MVGKIKTETKRKTSKRGGKAAPPKRKPSQMLPSVLELQARNRQLEVENKGLREEIKQLRQAMLDDLDRWNAKLQVLLESRGQDKALSVEDRGVAEDGAAPLGSVEQPPDAEAPN